MHRPIRVISKNLFLAVLILLCFEIPELTAEEKETSEKPSSAQGSLQQRIDFGNSHILGQSIKSGAVYLMHRKKSDIKNMLEVRKNYREEIKEDFDLQMTAISQGQVDTEPEKKESSQSPVNAKPEKTTINLSPIDFEKNLNK